MKRLSLVLLTVALLSSCGKADIKEDCIMNGLGAGHCSFTNAGSAKGSVCGKITVTKRVTNETTASELFCSGTIEPNSTVKVEFTIPAVDDFCDPGYDAYKTKTKWIDICYFEFKRNETK